MSGASNTLRGSRRTLNAACLLAARLAPDSASRGTGCAFSLINFVTKRCPSLTRSISIAIDSTACSSRSSRASPTILSGFSFDSPFILSTWPTTS